MCLGSYSFDYRFTEKNKKSNSTFGVSICRLPFCYRNILKEYYSDAICAIRVTNANGVSANTCCTS